MSQDIDIASLSPEMTELLAPAINTPVVHPDGRTVAGPRNKITYREAMESLRGNTAFNEMRREYSNSIAAQQGQGNMGQNQNINQPPSNPQPPVI
jgi:hypothetical protein